MLTVNNVPYNISIYGKRFHHEGALLYCKIKILLQDLKRMQYLVSYCPNTILNSNTNEILLNRWPPKMFVCLFCFFFIYLFYFIIIFFFFFAFCFFLFTFHYSGALTNCEFSPHWLWLFSQDNRIIDYY